MVYSKWRTNNNGIFSKTKWSCTAVLCCVLLCCAVILSATLCDTDCYALLFCALLCSAMRRRVHRDCRSWKGTFGRPLVLHKARPSSQPRCFVTCRWRKSISVIRAFAVELVVESCIKHVSLAVESPASGITRVSAASARGARRVL